MITVDFASEEDVRRNYGALVGKTVRAVAFKDGDEVVGCAGLYLDGGRLVLFSDMRDEVRKAPRALVRAYRTLLGIAARIGLAVHAVPSPGIEASVRFLEHMGFRPLNLGVYEWRK